MANRLRWLVWFLPLLFVGALLGLAWHQDHDFWRSASSLQRLAQEAARQGENPRALELARKAWAREPADSGYGLFLGQMYLLVGRPQEALEVARQVAARDPKSQGAVRIQAQGLDLLGQRPEALALLDQRLKDNPEEPETLACAASLAAQRPEERDRAVTYYERLYQVTRDHLVRRQLLDLLLSLDRFQEAIPLQEEEVAQLPESQEALHRLALLYYWQRDYQAATQLYQRLLEKSAGDAVLRQEAAKTADAAQDVDKALAHYLWLYGHYQGKKEYAVALARLWAQKGNHAEAAGVLAPLMQEQPEPELRRWYGLELVLLGDFAKAMTQYQAAWKAGDTHQETIINLARLYGQKRQFDRAAAMWDEAARRQLLTGELRWEAALTYSYARRFQDAVEVLQPLQRRDPKDPRLQLFLGQLHFYQKHWGQAAHYFTAYLKTHPQDAEVRRQLAEALSFQPEKLEGAIANYGEALKLKDDVGLRLRRISLLLKARRWEEAARELKACPTPEDPRLLKEVAHLYLWLGDLEGALQHCDLFLKKSPQDRGGRLEKARILTYLGRAPEALELLNRLRLEQPRDPTVRVAAIEAYLTGREFGKALILAQKELEGLPDLNLEERALVARCYFHSPNPKHLKRAMDLVVENLHKKRYHHPSLLILAAIVPKLPRYEDLDYLMDRLPGTQGAGHETAASLAYFDSQLGRHGGKVNYLLHVLNQYRRHKWPASPGELVGLAWLAAELGDKQAAAGYLRQALRRRPNDQQIAALLLRNQLDRKEWGQALATLEKQPDKPGAPLEMARLYLMRGQYEGVKAMVARIPEDSIDHHQALLLLAQACRGEHSYQEALSVLGRLEGKIPREEWLMEKARTLEAMGDKRAADLYEAIVQAQPGTQVARVATARRAKARENWAAAYKDYAEALKQAPADIELLNELEYVRQQMRPQMASRGFPYSRGEHRPEEAQRPWQFSRFGREPRGLGLSNYLPAFLTEVIPIVQPESLFFTDSNKLYGGIFRLEGAFWLTKVLPARIGAEYREYNQDTEAVKQGRLNLGLNQVYDQQTRAASRLRRAEVSLGLGPLAVEDRLRLSGEIILRRYWRRDDLTVWQYGQQRQFVPLPIPHFIIFNTTVSQGITQKDDRNRFLGSLELGFSPTSRTDMALRYSRRDIFDQETYAFPRLYQSVLNLTEAQVTTYHQVDLSYTHQFKPGLEWRGTAAGAFFSDQNRRFTLYQGLTWQAIGQPRMHLDLTPQYYLAAYQQQQRAYFSPHAYHAFGLGLDFDRQIFRLPTIILQGTVQGVNQHGDFGPALQGLAALEWEFVHNFYMDLHFFYFREWVDNYRLLTAGASFRWRF
jgi:predicted Zn-dependent protease